MKITIGYAEHLGAGTPTVIERRDGTPIEIEGLGLTLSFADGVLTVHGPGDVMPVVRPTAGNEIEVKAVQVWNWNRS